LKNLARCGYTLRVTSQTSYSPEYMTPTQIALISKELDSVPKYHILEPT
jgi:hypothetical protein